MEDRGSIAEKALIKSGLNKGLVAERLKIDRRTLYNKLKRPDLEYDFIIDLYKILRLDVTQDFPELGKYLLKEEVFEPTGENQAIKSAFEKCREETDMWRNKYIQLLEEHTLLLKEIRRLQGKKDG